MSVNSPSLDLWSLAKQELPLTPFNSQNLKVLVPDQAPDQDHRQSHRPRRA